MRAAPKHDPMPKRPTTLYAPFDRKKREIRQCLPGGKRLFAIGDSNTVMPKKNADVSSIRPEPIILRQNAELLTRVLYVLVCHSGKRGDAGDTASGGLLLDYWLHRIEIMMLSDRCSTLSVQSI